MTTFDLFSKDKKVEARGFKICKVYQVIEELHANEMKLHYIVFLSAYDRHMRFATMGKI